MWSERREISKPGIPCSLTLFFIRCSEIADVMVDSCRYFHPFVSPRWKFTCQSVTSTFRSEIGLPTTTLNSNAEFHAFQPPIWSPAYASPEIQVLLRCFSTKRNGFKAPLTTEKITCLQIHCRCLKDNFEVLNSEHAWRHFFKFRDLHWVYNSLQSTFLKLLPMSSWPIFPFRSL